MRTWIGRENGGREEMERERGIGERIGKWTEKEEMDLSWIILCRE